MLKISKLVSYPMNVNGKNLSNVAINVSIRRNKNA